jgi:hypothetical protein
MSILYNLYIPLEEMKALSAKGAKGSAKAAKEYQEHHGEKAEHIAVESTGAKAGNAALSLAI